MIKVSDIVLELLMEDNLAREAYLLGILNLSAYAEHIQEEVEERTLKPIRKGTIIVALSRIDKKLLQQDPLQPKVVINNICVKSALCEITYEKTTSNLNKLAHLNTAWIGKREFFALTEGLAEITIICPKEASVTIMKHFGSTPKVEFEKLVAVTVRFSADYLNVPNTIFTLMASLAAQRINIIEVVSTFTEISFIVRQEELEKSIAALNKHFE